MCEETAAFVHILPRHFPHKFGFVRDSFSRGRWWRVAAVAVTGTALSLWWRSGALATGPTLCPFRLLTGLPCPGCGTTRAVGALLAGDLPEAWALNPVGLLLVAVGVGTFLIPESRPVLSRAYEAALARGWRWQLVAAAAVLYASLWAWNLSRW